MMSSGYSAGTAESASSDDAPEAIAGHAAKLVVSREE
jgi:hypothetical protein